VKSRIASASVSNMSPSLYLSVLSSLSKMATLNNASEVRPLISSPGKNPVVVVPIPIFAMIKYQYLDPIF